MSDNFNASIKVNLDTQAAYQKLAELEKRAVSSSTASREGPRAQDPSQLAPDGSSSFPSPGAKNSRIPSLPVRSRLWGFLGGLIGSTYSNTRAKYGAAVEAHAETWAQHTVRAREFAGAIMRAQIRWQEGRDAYYAEQDSLRGSYILSESGVIQGQIDENSFAPFPPRQVDQALQARMMTSMRAASTAGRKLEAAKVAFASAARVRTYMIVGAYAAAVLYTSYKMAYAAPTAKSFISGLTGGSTSGGVGGMALDNILNKIQAIESWITSHSDAFTATKEHAIAAARATGNAPDLWRSYWIEHAAANAQNLIEKKFHRWKDNEFAYVMGNKFFEMVRWSTPF